MLVYCFLVEVGRLTGLQKYIYEHDAVREVLIALQGRANIMLQWQNDAYQTTNATPRLLHLSLASQASILSSLGEECSCVRHLRTFISQVFSTASSSKSKTRTLEAFADAVDTEIRLLDSWCADMEEKFVLATNGALHNQGLVVSLLSLEIQIRDTFEGSFGVLLNVIRSVFGENYSPRASPSTTTAALLDRLFVVIQENLERGERITAGVAMRVFVRSSEPLWGMVGQWLKDGMGVGDVNDLDDEFFIESNGLGSGVFGVGLLDPDYWTEGYTLRYEDEEDGRRKGLPTFFTHVAGAVLASGKSVGLLKALGIASTGIEWKWRSLAELVAQGSDEDEASGLFSVSFDTLSSLIHDELAPYCQSTSLALSRAVVDECAFWKHLGTIEDIYLMRKGDAMSHFCDALFAKVSCGHGFAIGRELIPIRQMDSQQHWTDFHFLNTTFSDMVESSVNVGAREWVQQSLVRLSYRGAKSKSATRTVRGLDGLLIEYAVPFPLIYIFTPKTMQIYGDLFVFLLQIKRAKVVLERILVRGDSRKVGSEMKTFYAIRSRISWFIK
jgi:gamma-tubulin complex component 5